jgi:hypothetical protein
MTALSYIVEPEALLLTWQPLDEKSPNRTRRIVARIEKAGDTGASFHYLSDTDDYRSAIDAGFKGHPAFHLGSKIFSEGVMESFLRRLPPRKREDFSDFLKLHRLPVPFTFSDFALLAYTGARLPSDGFAVVPCFDENKVPCDFILEVAGFRHELGAAVDSIQIGDEISFQIENNNLYDADAIAIIHNEVRIGYVNRALKDVVRSWIKNSSVTSKIERINGKSDRPLVYVRLEVR